MPVGRPLFKRTQNWVAVKPVRHKGRLIKPGEPITREDFKLHHLRSLYQRLRIGVVDTPWTELALKKRGVVSHWFHDNVKLEDELENEEQEGGLQDETGDGTNFNETRDGTNPDETDDGANPNETDDGANPNKTGDEDDDFRVDELNEPDEFNVNELNESEESEESNDEPEEPIKIGSQWGFETLTTKKFTSRVKALAWRNSQTGEGSNG